MVDSNFPMFNFSYRMDFLLWCTVLCFQCFFIGCQSQTNGPNIQVLDVGKELEKQFLPFSTRQGLYGLHGLKQSRWYEVKISYPASIPARFSIQLQGNLEDLWINKNRRLLNTEKLIFKADGDKSSAGHDEMYAIVTVEPDGVVAKPHVQERGGVLFNIVCDELSFGIPNKTWWVGAAAILCLVLALVIPCIIPLQKLLEIQTSHTLYSAETKAS